MIRSIFPFSHAIAPSVANLTLFSKKTMKTSFASRRTILNAAFALGLLAQAISVFGASDDWKPVPGTADWNTGANWVGGLVPNGAADVATFATSTITSLSLSADTTVDGMVFSLGANAFTITTTHGLFFSTTGITNSSVATQSFVVNTGGVIEFDSAANAGIRTSFTNNGGTVNLASGGLTRFYNTADAGSGTFINNGGTVTGALGGQTIFYNSSTAGSGTFTNNGATVSGVASGVTYFYNSSNAGTGTFTNYGGTVSGAWGGITQFDNTSDAGTGTFNNIGTAVSGASGGTTVFKGSSTANGATLNANNGAVAGGGIYFYATSTGGTAIVTATGNGFLDISNHTGAMGIGSIAGSGNFFLGSNTLTTGGNGGSTTVSGVIQDGGNNGGVGGGLTKTGAGTMILSGANTYTGLTTISVGVLQIGNAGTTGSLGRTSSIIDNASLILDRSNTLTQGLAGFGDFTAISGTGTVTQAGAGTTILTLANTYTGGTTISAGTLQIGSGGTTGSLSTSSAIVDNAALKFYRSNTMTQGVDFASNITGTGTVTQSGSGKTILTGANNYSGVTTVQAGTLQFGTVSSLYNGVGGSWTVGNIIVNSGATLALNVGGAGEFAAADLNTIKALGNGAGGFMNGSTLGIDTTNAGGTFTPTTAITDTNGGANSIGLTKLGTGTLILTLAPTYTGRTIVLGGSLQINAPLTVGINGLTVASGATMSATALTVASSSVSVASGGSLSVGGAFTATNTSILLDGTLTSPTVTLYTGTVISGTGTLHGDLINTSGVVAPGHSPGTLTVNGNFTQGRNGTFQLQVGSVNWFDQLNVSGRASLGGTLQVQNWAGNTLSYGQQVAFLHAGSIVGSFDSITMPDARLRGRFLVDGGTGTLLVAPASYAQVAKTTNQMNVAKALDHYITAVGNDREVVSTALDKMSENQYPAAFDAISPAFHESIANITIEQAFVQTQMINQRLSSVRLGAQGFQLIGMNAEPLTYDKNGKKSADPKDLKTVIQQDNVLNWSTWAMGTGTFGKITDVSQIPNSHSESGSCLIGADYRWNEHFSTGLYGGYQGTYVDYTNKSSNRMNSALFGGYATYTAGGFYADSVIGGGVSTYDVRRTIAFSTIKRTAQSDQQSGQLNAALNLGYDFKVSGFTLGPIVGAQYTYVGIAPFTETGASSLNLAVKQQNANSMRTTLGGRVAYTWNATSKLVLIPEVRMLWENEFLNGSRPIDATLAGGKGPSFSGWTDSPSRSSAFAGAGVSAQFGANWNASLFYNVDFGRQTYLANMISASLGLKF